MSLRAWKSVSWITVFDGEFWEITMETHATFAAIHISNLFQNDVKNILKHKLVDQIMFKSQYQCFGWVWYGISKLYISWEIALRRALESLKNITTNPSISVTSVDVRSTWSHALMNFGGANCYNCRGTPIWAPKVLSLPANRSDWAQNVGFSDQSNSINLKAWYFQSGWSEKFAENNFRSGQHVSH